ncbi:MAG: hypothetical protein WAX66_01185 [Patescibacteria group bacterium]
MNRAKLNVRMDLMRVAKTALDADKPFEEQIANTFIDKAKSELENNLKDDYLLRDELVMYQKQIPNISSDTVKRLHWGEKILTIASRLGIL